VIWCASHSLGIFNAAFGGNQKRTERHPITFDFDF
jgi:hypothetical protein